MSGTTRGNVEIFIQHQYQHHDYHSNTGEYEYVEGNYELTALGR